jgi:cytoskeleton protein RodZ
VPPTRRTSRDAALVELQRLHAAILASRAQRGASASGGPAVDSPSPEALAAQALTRRLQASADVPADEPTEPEARSRRGWWLALAAAVIVGGAWMAMTMTQRPEVVTEAAPPGPKTAAPDPSPVAPTPAAAPAAAVTPARPIRVTLATIRPVWLRVTVDGVRALEREVPAGETLSFDGDRAVLVRSGDAGGVRASMNGTDRGPLGKDGWPLTVPFTIDAPAPPQ